MRGTPNEALIQFGSALQRRRLEAGKPSYAQIVRLAADQKDSISKASISYMLNGDLLPRWELVRVYVDALLRYEKPSRPPGQAEAEIEHWRSLWTAAYVRSADKSESESVAKQQVELPTDASPTGAPTSEPTATMAPTPDIRATPDAHPVPPNAVEQPYGEHSTARMSQTGDNIKPGYLVPVIEKRVDRSTPAMQAPRPVLSVGAERVLREEIFAALRDVAKPSGTVTREQLWDFTMHGQTHRLIDRSRGIRNPRNMHASLSVMSAPDGAWGSEDDQSGSLMAYAYREGSINGDNAKLRNAFSLGLPLILLRKLDPGVFLPVFPMHVIADDQSKRQFLLGPEESLLLNDPVNPSPIEKRYMRGVMAQRLYEPEFRARVLRAYEFSCAVCQLAQIELLEAVDIRKVATKQARGGEGPERLDVTSGLCLCNLHRAAYDSDLFGISPDYLIHADHRVMSEDNLMMRHAFQEMHGRHLSVPPKVRDRPSRSLLAERYDAFVRTRNR